MDEKFDISLYNDEFFEWHRIHVHDNCKELGRILAQEYDVKSLVDFGCGIGSFLQGALSHGVKKVFGVEIGGEYAKKYTDKSMQGFINFNGDLTKLIVCDHPFDVSICTEVAEHIETQYSEILIENICRNTERMCVFTGAHPGQQGCGHINCQPKEFWMDLFKKNGFSYSGVHTNNLASLWSNAPQYYLDNLMVFNHD
ncbi:MAG: class I SAM-dependent methyltransferase [Candidatus Marinimicrobia bacterium]|nr:class I SAM-dependent methyltransferase [Candidatus Neomarinimicrobiota bacterium]